VKPAFGTVATIIVVSLAVWVLFLVVTPGGPLTPPETLVVVGVCAALVLGVKWIWSRFQTRRGKDDRAA
jgi:protein-S-isoprenylcysteine O-methyltransferase Ste14